MEQIAVNFTDGWVPKTWLTPLATIIDLNGNVMVENGVCKELWYWWYIYSFDRYSPEKVYLYLINTLGVELLHLTLLLLMVDLIE